MSFKPDKGFLMEEGKGIKWRLILKWKEGGKMWFLAAVFLLEFSKFIMTNGETAVVFYEKGKGLI